MVKIHFQAQTCVRTHLLVWQILGACLTADAQSYFNPCCMLWQNILSKIEIPPQVRKGPTYST